MQAPNHNHHAANRGLWGTHEEQTVVSHQSVTLTSVMNLMSRDDLCASVPL